MPPRENRERDDIGLPRGFDKPGAAAGEKSCRERADGIPVVCVYVFHAGAPGVSLR